MEEELFVVIVGDPPVSQLPLSAFKFEPDKGRLITDVPVESILKQASIYSEIIDYDNIKKEPRDEDHLSFEEGSSSEEYEPENDSKETIEIEIPAKRKKKNKPAPPRERVLVDDLRATDVKSVCLVCNKEFPNVTEMQIHTSTVHEDILLPHKCAHCPAAYPHIIALKRHVKVKHSGVEYICDICQRVFNKKDNLMTHIEMHSSIKKFACEHCPKRYRKKFNLRLHVDKIHKKIPPPFICETCPNKRYYLMSQLKGHMKEEHGVTLMTNTNFLNRLPTMGKSLLTNTKIVTKEEMEKLRLKTEDQYIEDKKQLKHRIKKFACNYCSKRYAKVYDLNLHIKKEHKKIEPRFACDICDRKYYAMSPLKFHMQKEHGVTLINKSKLMENLPDKKIVDAKLLTKEEFEKLGEQKEQSETTELKYISMMRFPCLECDNTYELKSDLKKHMEQAHEGMQQPVVCQVCHKEYNKLISLKRHMKRQHNMIIMTPRKFQTIMPKLTKTQIEEAQYILKSVSHQKTTVNENVETADDNVNDNVDDYMDDDVEETLTEEVVDQEDEEIILGN